MSVIDLFEIWPDISINIFLSNKQTSEFHREKERANIVPTAEIQRCRTNMRNGRHLKNQKMRDKCMGMAVRLEWTEGGVMLCNFLSNLSSNGWRCIVAVAEVRCYTAQRELSNLQRFLGGWRELRHGWMIPKKCTTLQKVELSSTSCNVARNRNVARQVAEVTCYTVQFFSNLAVATQIAEELHAIHVSYFQVFQMSAVSPAYRLYSSET